MNKKFTVVAILAILMTVTMSSTMAVAQTAAEDGGSLIGVFDSGISLEKEKEFEDPILPSGSEEVKLTVGFKLVLGSIAGQLLFNRRIGRMILFGPGHILKRQALPKATINLELLEVPDWCTAEFENSAIKLNYSTSLDSAEVVLTIEVNDTATALESANITVRATYSGHWTIKPASSKTTIEFMSAFVSGLEYEEEIKTEVPPINETYIPINITNVGNGDTEIDIAIDNIPDNWNVSLDIDTIIIPADEGDDTSQINLIVEPLDEEFDNETILLTLTSKSASDEDIDDKYLEGESFTISVFIENDGSLEDDDEIGMEIILSVVLIIIVIIIIAISYLLYTKKEE